MVLEALTPAEGRGNLTCHPWEPLDGSSVTHSLVPFLPLGMGISVLCLSHHPGVGADILFQQAHKWKEFFSLLASGYFLQAPGLFIPSAM